MSPHLEQRIANRVRVEVAKIVQHGQEPDPEAIKYGHFLGADYQFDFLDRVELACGIDGRLALMGDEVVEACEKRDATVGTVIEAAKRAYVKTHGEKEVV